MGDLILLFVFLDGMLLLILSVESVVTFMIRRPTFLGSVCMLRTFGLSFLNFLIGLLDLQDLKTRSLSCNGWLDKTIVMIWTEFIYEVWHQRNSKTFKGLIDPPVRAARSIMFRVACRDHYDYAVL